MSARPVTICECGDHAFAPLTLGYVALIDPEFAPAIGLWNWNAKLDHGNVYARRSHHEQIDGRRQTFTVMMHTVVLPAPETAQVDHRDGDTLNNRRGNLRIANSSGNGANRKKRFGSTSKYRGVTSVRDRWQAVITLKGKQRYLGVFDSEEAAALAYDRAAREVHGQFARPNFEAAA